MRVNFKVTEWEKEPDPMFNPFRLDMFAAEFDGIGNLKNFLFRWIRQNTDGVAKEIEITS